jgi:hypothetical protein
VAKSLREKGFPLFNDIVELVGGTRATGEHAFRAGQPNWASSTQNTTASYELVIDPTLLEISLEGGRISDGEMDHNNPLVRYIH